LIGFDCAGGFGFVILLNLGSATGGYKLLHQDLVGTQIARLCEFSMNVTRVVKSVMMIIAA